MMVFFMVYAPRKVNWYPGNDGNGGFNPVPELISRRRRSAGGADEAATIAPVACARFAIQRRQRVTCADMAGEPPGDQRNREGCPPYRSQAATRVGGGHVCARRG